MNIRRIIDRYFIKNPALRQRVTRWIEGDKDQKIQLFGVDLLVNSVREHGYLRASRTAKWSSVFGDEAPVLLSLASLLPHIDMLVDAGANVGLVSSALGRMKKLYPKLRVAAFEADPNTFKRLQQNVCGSDMTTHNLAVSDSSGILNFIRGAVSHVTTTQDKANAYSLGDEFCVESRRLDSFEIPGNRIMLKIDVEGQEWKVLKGAERWFVERRCVCVYLDGFENRDEIFGFFQRHGFELRDGRTLEPAGQNTFALLAMQKEWLETVVRR